MKSLCLTLICVVSCFRCFASDWPQFRGPSRDGVSREAGLLQSWPDGGPKRLWLADSLGNGYSGPAIVAGKIYIAGQRDNAQWLLSLDAANGKELWSTRLGEVYGNEFGDGPRGTPTVHDGLVYALGANGELLCAEAATGVPQWRANLVDFGGKMPDWGYSESPLVDGSRVVFTPGGERGAVVALDAQNGSLVWQSKDFTDLAQYTSLMALDKQGVRQYACVNRENITGIAADDGRMLWQEKFRSGVVVAQMPIVSGDTIYATAAGGTGCKAVKLLAPDESEIVYANKIMKNLPGGVVLFDGHIYGYSDNRGWMCQDFLSGESVWEDKSFGKGVVTIAGGRLICVEEDTGAVLLADASPKGWREISRFTLSPQSANRQPKSKVWTPPVVSGGKLYLRDQEYLICFDYAADD